VWLTRFCLNNPIAVTLFYVFVGVAGAIAVLAMGRSILPPVSLPVVTIDAPYPGASSTEIERLIVEPLEDQLNQLPDLDRVSASAQNGTASVVVQFRFASDLDVDRTNVQQAVDAARADMPADLLPPVVSKDDPAQAPVLEESVGSAVVQPGELAELVNRQIAPALRATSGAGTVRVVGTRTRQFTVVPRAGRLEALGATPLDVLRAVSLSNDVLPGGVLRSPVRESTIGIRAAATSAAELRALPLGIPGGPSVRLEDVASVDDGYAEQTAIARVDGDAAVILYVSPAQGQDSLRTIGAVRKTFALLAQSYPLLRFEELRTDAPFVNASVWGVLQTIGEGVVLTVLVILAFLHAWRNALIAAIAIPASMCAAFAAMWALGLTLNVLSLMGLSLTIGILVDDSIVIIEAIARSAARGLDAEAAALAGRKELGGAAFAITLVDVAVFAPIAFMSGLIGEFMREFGLVVVLATAFSLLVSFTLTPLLSARWALRHRPLWEGLSFAQVLREIDARKAGFPWTFRTRFALRALAGWHACLNTFNSWDARLARSYAGTWLPKAFANRRRVMIAISLACLASLVPLFSGGIPTEFSPPVSRGTAAVNLSYPAGTPLAQSDAFTQRLTAALLQDPAVKHVEASSGLAFDGRTDVRAGNLSQLDVVLADPGASGDDVVDRIKSLAYLVPTAAISGAGKSMGGTAPISYDVTGSPGAIDVAAGKIAESLRANAYATDVRTSNGGIGPRIQIGIDAGKARLLDVAADDAAQTARIVTGGTIATKARLTSGLVDVVVRSDAAQTGDLERVDRFTIRSGDGKLIPLGDVADVESTTEPTVVARENGKRVVTVSANTAGDAPTGLVSGPMTERLRDPNFLPPGTRIEPRGDVAQFLDAVSKMMTALALSLVAVYAILAILYRSYRVPLVVMSTVPLASIGAFGTLYALNVLREIFPGVALFEAQTLNLYSMLGIIMLVGLVAKNGILLVEFAERAVREGTHPEAAMLDAAHRRFRPILMTTLAMIAGMLPLALGDTAGAQYRKALGSVVIGGLSSSLFLTLFIVPIAYVAVRRRVKPPSFSLGEIERPAPSRLAGVEIP
jgi:HAE1 family hydrophobic/amphiphilic exporter-1